jgi:hypothetical protein
MTDAELLFLTKKAGKAFFEIKIKENLSYAE